MSNCDLPLPFHPYLEMYPLHQSLAQEFAYAAECGTQIAVSEQVHAGWAVVSEFEDGVAVREGPVEVGLANAAVAVERNDVCEDIVEGAEEEEERFFGVRGIAAAQYAEHDGRVRDRPDYRGLERCARLLQIQSDRVLLCHWVLVTGKATYLLSLIDVEFIDDAMGFVLGAIEDVVGGGVLLACNLCLGSASTSWLIASIKHSKVMQ